MYNIMSHGPQALLHIHLEHWTLHKITWIGFLAHCINFKNYKYYSTIFDVHFVVAFEAIIR
jgi:hypothetical protein